MATIAQLVVDLRAQTAAFNRSMRTANKHVASMRRSTESLRASVQSATAVMRGVGGVIASMGLAIGAREALQMAESFKVVEARLKLVTDSQRELIETQRELFAIAQRSRTEFAGTADLFARIARVSDESNERILRLTETIQKAAVVSGGDQASLAAGIQQLSQALGSGVLRGEEFNSVMENTPRIAQALSASLGVSIGQLREMAEQGELTSERVVNALLDQSEVIEAEFAQMPKTVGQAFAVLNNELAATFAAADKASSGTSMLADSITDLADFVRELRPEVQDLAAALTGNLTPAQQVSDEVKGLASVLILAEYAVDALATSLANTLGTALEVTGTAIGGLAAATMALVQGEFSQARDIISMVFDDISNIVIEDSTELRETLFQDTQAMAERLVQLWDSTARKVAESTAQASRAVQQAREASAQAQPVDQGVSTEQIEQFRAQLQTEIEALQEHFKTRQELEQEWYANRQLLITNALNMQLISEEEARALREELARAHADRMTAIEEESLSRQHQLWRQGWLGKLSVMSDILGTMGALMQSESRSMFEIGKAAAISETIIRAYSSATKAYDALAGIPIVGPALGAAAAAAAISAGLANAQRIKSTQFGSSAAGGGGYVAAGGAAASASGSVPQVQGPFQEGRTERLIIINLDEDRFYTGRAVRHLMEQIAEQTGDNVRFRS